MAMRVMVVNQTDNLVVVLTDFAYFADNEEAVDEWCWQTFGYRPRVGMVMTFREPSHTNWFILKWG
jgi:hypothetical protein